MGLFKLKLLPLALSAVFVVSSVLPSQAFTNIPIPTPAERVLTENTQMVQYRRDDNWRRGYHRRGGEAYYNGHRGYRDRRPGYRRHNGVWFPLAAFATGAIIGGAMSNDRPVRYGGSHVEWCADRYRSYRAYDNTYQPNNGPRRQCNSPY